MNKNSIKKLTYDFQFVLPIISDFLKIICILIGLLMTEWQAFLSCRHQGTDMSLYDDIDIDKKDIGDPKSDVCEYL